MPELLLISLLPSPVGDFWMTYALLCLFPQVFINANLIFQEIFSLLLLTAGLWLPFFFPTHVRPGWFSRMPASFISVRADEQNQACWLPFLACSSRERSTTKCSVGQVTDILHTAIEEDRPCWAAACILAGQNNQQQTQALESVWKPRELTRCPWAIFLPWLMH